jgi:hypothetical protein
MANHRMAQAKVVHPLARKLERCLAHQQSMADTAAVPILSALILIAI